MLLLKKKYQRRAALISFIVLCFVIAIGLILKAFNDNIIYFYSPYELSQQMQKSSDKLRIGGLVKEGSVFFNEKDLQLKFTITDNIAEVVVVYHGIPPNLFRANQGTVALGKFNNGIFIAQELLAKHDENYMPKEVYQKLRQKAEGMKKDA